jgi:hypothetical protein
MGKCEYSFLDAEKTCNEEPLKGSNLCILHHDFPEDETGNEFKKIKQLKDEKIKERVKKAISILREHIFMR